MVGVLAVLAILAGLQITDLRQKRAKGEDYRGVILNLVLLVVAGIAATLDHL